MYDQTGVNYVIDLTSLKIDSRKKQLRINYISIAAGHPIRRKASVTAPSEKVRLCACNKAVAIYIILLVHKVQHKNSTNTQITITL